MAEYDLTRKSRPVVIVGHQTKWAEEYQRIGRHIRSLVGNAVVRIDHIGSTAVPELGAKDVIDIQITLADLEQVEDFLTPLHAAGFREGLEFDYDDFHQMPVTDLELRKRYVREPDGERRTHIHVREQGRFNQRYALLFRDFLRATPTVRREYELFKQRAAQLFPECIDGYLFLKEPVFHLIYETASLWAEKTNWQPDNDFL